MVHECDAIRVCCVYVCVDGCVDRGVCVGECVDLPLRLGRLQANQIKWASCGTSVSWDASLDAITCNAQGGAQLQWQARSTRHVCVPICLLQCL